MKITKAEFTVSAVGKNDYPAERLPEIVLIGRSNVGKSSLINRLVNRKKLARTSSTPGKTQTINFYMLNKAFFLVDLPGFGYAKVPRDVKKAWGPMVEKYLGSGRNVAGAIVVLDIRRTPAEAEKVLYEWLSSLNIQLLTVLTKADKFSRSRSAQKAREVGALLPGDRPLIFSAVSGLGKADLLKRIHEMTAHDSAPEEET